MILKNRLQQHFKTLRARLKYNPLRKKNKRGIALLLAITSLLLMVYVASEVSMDSTIEYAVNIQEVNRIKAYYAARNSMDIALLRVKTFQQAAKLQLPEGFKQQLDQIWKFPFSWPLPISSEMLGADKDSLEKAQKEALFDGQYEHQILDEGSKIDINDLASPSKVLRDVTKKQLLTIFEQRIQGDDKFREQYQNFRFEELINRIADWMSSTNTSANGGDKKGAFSELGEFYPPNRGFRTIDELRLVPGMNEEFFTILSPLTTIYGMKAINPNVAAQNVLKSLDAGITDEAIKEAIERRDDPEKGGPFKGGTSEECRKDFKSFIESRGSRLSTEFDQIPFMCDKVTNFRVIATGRSGGGKGAVQKKIVAVTMDINKAALQVRNYIDEERKQQQQAAGQTPQNPNGTAGPKSPPAGQSQTSAQDPLPKGRPRIVYWAEF